LNTGAIGCCGKDCGYEVICGGGLDDVDCKGFDDFPLL